MTETSDLTVIFYTANIVPQGFLKQVLHRLYAVTQGLPKVYIEQPKDIPRSHLQIYKNALSGARLAQTRYVAFAEDDVLYSPEHFKYRPRTGKFCYNKSIWSIYTWVTPYLFSWKDRRNLHSLICERSLFIEAMEERFAKYTEDKEQELGNEWFVKYWAEPGKYEGQLGVTKRETEEFFTEPPNIAFSHETALSFAGLGRRKKLGHMRAYEVPYWGRAQDIAKLYEI